jgi:hypothetical protein
MKAMARNPSTPNITRLPSRDPAAFRAPAAEKKLLNSPDDFSFEQEIT